MDQEYDHWADKGGKVKLSSFRLRKLPCLCMCLPPADFPQNVAASVALANKNTHIPRWRIGNGAKWSLNLHNKMWLLMMECYCTASALNGKPARLNTTVTKHEKQQICSHPRTVQQWDQHRSYMIDSRDFVCFVIDWYWIWCSALYPLITSFTAPKLCSAVDRTVQLSMQ